MRPFVRFSEIGTFNQLLEHHSLKTSMAYVYLMKTLCIIKTPLNNTL
ncbi:MAG: hypothetical protein FMNOHCHN_00554 [Ignavibacteriaceae bacterium]|nr:hypothetical protein [Ignavibacteriaceae bacterium]